MDNDTLNSTAQTNTPTEAPTPEATPAPEPINLTPEATTPEIAPSPTANTIPTPAGDTSTPSNPVPINDVEEAPPADPIPLVDAGSTIPNIPTPAGSTVNAANATNITNPTTGTTANPAVASNNPAEPTVKRSPILNPAPAKVQKFDLKYLIPIIVLGMIVLGLGIYLIVDKVALEPKALEAARKAAAASAAPVVSTDVDVNTGSASDEPLIMTYSSSDSLNGTGTYLLTSIDNAEGVSVTSNDAATVAEFSIDWAKAKAAYSDLKTSTGTSTYTIDFGQGITEIFYGQVGTTGYYLFLLDDGTVDYLDIHQALLNKSFVASGPIDGVEEVVKFLDATTNNTATILAQQSSGEYYDLSTFLK